MVSEFISSSHDVDWIIENYLRILLVRGAEGFAGGLWVLFSSGFIKTLASRTSLSAVVIIHWLVLVLFFLAFLGSAEMACKHVDVKR